MTVAITSAMALAVGDSLAGYSGDALVEAMITLSILVGLFALLLGVLKLGTLTTDTIPPGDIFMADDTLGSSTRRALAAAQQWLEGQQEGQGATDTTEPDAADRRE